MGVPGNRTEMMSMTSHIAIVMTLSLIVIIVTMIVIIIDNNSNNNNNNNNTNNNKGTKQIDNLLDIFFPSLFFDFW